MAFPETATEGPWPLPEGWCWVEIVDVVDPVRTTDPKRDLGEKYFHYIDLSALENGHVTKAQLISGLEAPSRARQVVQAGDTLFSCVRVYLHNIALLGTGFRNPVASTAYCVMRPGPAVEPRYLNYFVRSRRFIEWMIPLQRGNSPPAVLDADVKAQPFPLPPLAEQRRIVARIDALFAEIDEGEAALATARDGLDTFRRALLKAAVTGELTADWRAASPQLETGQNLLDQIRAIRETSTKGRGGSKGDAQTNFSELATLPDDWTWATLGNLSSLVTDGDHNPPKRVPEGIPHITAKNIKRGRLTLDGCSFVSQEGYAQTAARYTPVNGDVLITCVGTLGEVAIFRSPERISVDRNIAAVRPVEQIPSEFIELCLNSPRTAASLRRASGSTAQPHLYLKEIRSIAIPIPPSAEMFEIVRRVSEALAASADALGVLDAEAADAARLKQSILKAAYEGRLVPQDSTDEPAAALLARLATTASAPARAKRGRSARSHA